MVNLDWHGYTQVGQTVNNNFKPFFLKSSTLLAGFGLQFRMDYHYILTMQWYKKYTLA